MQKRCTADLDGMDLKCWTLGPKTLDIGPQIMFCPYNGSALPQSLHAQQKTWKVYLRPRCGKLNFAEYWWLHRTEKYIWKLCLDN